MEIDLAALGTVVTGLGLGGIVISLINWWRGHDGDEADAAATLVSASATGVAALSAAIDQLRAELTTVHADLVTANETIAAQGERISDLEVEVASVRENERKLMAWAISMDVWPPAKVLGGQAIWDSL